MNSSLWKGAFMMGSGAAIAQAIGVAALPVITRLYSPSDFGILGLFISIVTILLAVTSLGYEFAIPLPKQERSSFHLCVLCFVILVSTCALLSVIMAVSGSFIADVFKIQAIMPYFWVIILGLLCSGTYTILNYWATRQRDYATITRTRINQSVSGAIAKISLGALLAGPIGLLIGQIFINAAGIGTIGKKFWKANKNYVHVSVDNLKQVARKYWDFPVFSVPAQLISRIGLQLPVIALSAIYGTDVTGLYVLSYSMVTLPASLISGSIAQSFYAETARIIRENPSILMHQFTETVKKLSYISVPLIVIPSLISPFLFPIVFGNSWKDAGIYVLPLVLVAVSSFIVVPTSKLALFGCNHWEFGFHVARTSLLISGFFIAYTLHFTPFSALVLYGSLMMVSYGVLLLLNIVAIKRTVSSSGNPEQEATE